MYRKILPVITLLVLVTGVNAQHHRHSTAQFIVKPHTPNTTTVERDSVGGGLGLLIGAVDQAPKVINDSLFSITGTAIDTSFAYRTWPFMGFLLDVDDAITDSINLRIKFYFGAKSEFLSRRNESELPPPFGYYAVIDSVDITSNTPAWYYLGSNADMPPGSWFYITVEGLTGNKLTIPVSLRIIASFYDDTKVIR